MSTVSCSWLDRRGESANAKGLHLCALLLLANNKVATTSSKGCGHDQTVCACVCGVSEYPETKCRGMKQACGASSNKALHSGLRISGTPGDVPAFNLSHNFS